MLDRRSEEDNSPGAGIAGSLRERFIMTCDLLRSEIRLSSLGEPRLLLERLSDAFIAAAAASECVDGLAEGLELN